MGYARLAIILFVVSFQVQASFLGPVDQVQNLPGYIEFNQEDPFFKGPHTIKQRAGSQDRRTPSEILSYFFDGEKMSQAKLQELITSIEKRLNSTKHYECLKRSKGDIKEQEKCLKKNYTKKFLKKWKEEKYNIALSFIIENLKEVQTLAVSVNKKNINSVSSQKFLDKFFSAIELIEAVKAEDEQRGRFSSSYLGLLKAKEIFFSPDIVKADRIEAANLLIPKNHELYGKQMFFSYDGLSTYQSEGHDLSKLEPNSSGIWRKPKKSISEFNTTNYDQLDHPYIEKLVSQKTLKDKIVDHNEVIDVLYKDQDLSGGQSPKFDVRIDGEKWKLKFLTNKQDINGSNDPITKVIGYIWGSEVNVEPTVNNLAAALGFSVDPVHFKKKVRLYFEDEIYKQNGFSAARDKLIGKVTEKYPANTNAKSAFNKIRIDKNGRQYIELYSVALESKSNDKTDINIGFFGRDALGKNLNRAHRAFYIFLAWIGDLDVKDENDKVKLVPYTKADGSIDYKVMLSNSDMGGALGSGYPNIYNYPFVDKARKNGNGETDLLKLNFPRIYSFSLKRAVSINDAKWITRRIAQLSFKQIYDAYRSGGYPHPVSLYFTYVMAKKRNELVKALGMVGETFIDDGGKTFTIKLLKENFQVDPELKDYLLKDQFSENKKLVLDKSYEEWPRRWGISLNPFGGSLAHKTLAKAIKKDLARLIISDGLGFAFRSVDITQKGFKFRNIRIFNELEEDACKKNCFFDGLEAGVSHFIPMRHLVINEDDKTRAEYPYLLVDIFRLGLFLGDNGKFIDSLLGFNAETYRYLGARFYKMYEFIKVKPVKKLQSYFEEDMKLKQAPKLFYKNYKQSLVKNLTDGESMIVSSYLGQMLGGRVRPPLLGFSSFRLGTEHVRLSRLMLRADKNKINAYWSQNKSHLYGLSLNFFDYIVKLPFVEESLKYSNSHVYQYSFNKSQTQQMDILLKNITTKKPINLPARLKVDYQGEDVRKRTSTLNLLLLGKNKEKTATLKSYENFEKNFIFKSKRFDFETEKYKLVDIENTTTELDTFVMANNQNDFGVGLEVRVFHPRLVRPKFFQMISKLKSILPLKYLNLGESREDIKHYMGKVNLSSKVLFNKKALDLFFNQSLTLSDFHFRYLKRASLKDNFWRKYQRMRKLYHEIKGKPFNDIKLRSLKRLAKFIFDRNFRFGVLSLLKEKATANNYRDKLLITSDLEAFPGSIDTVETRSSTEEYPEDSELSSYEQFVESIEGFFYDNIYEII